MPSVPWPVIPRDSVTVLTVVKKQESAGRAGDAASGAESQTGCMMATGMRPVRCLVALREQCGPIGVSGFAAKFPDWPWPH